MKKIFLIGTILLITVPQLFGQVQLTQYYLDGTIYNPAFAGSKDAYCIGTYFRDQWIGLTDQSGNDVSPKTAVFYLHAPLDSIHSGIGFNSLYDRAGFEESLSLKINYSYFLKLKNKNDKLGFGIGLSVMHKSIDFGMAVLAQPNDPLIPNAVTESGIIPDIDLGIMYQNNKQYYLGLSVTNFLQSKAGIGNISYQQKRYLYTTGGFYLKMVDDGHRKLELIPTFLIKSNLINLQAEANARVEVNNLYWAGISLRYQDAVAAVAGINYKGFRFGASYDLTAGKLTGASYGSLEFFVGFCQPLEKIKTVHFNTRYL